MDSMLGWLKHKITFLHHLFKLEDQLANGLSFFVGIILAFGGIPPLSMNLLYGFLAVSGSLLGINLLNQITDIKIDKINKPHRPLPSGKMSENTATILSAILFLGACTFAVLASLQVFYLTIFYIFLGIVYSAEPIRLKERFLFNNLATAIGYNFLNFLIGWVIFQPILQAPFPLLLLLFTYDFIAINSKDYFDLAGDKKFGVKTLVSLLGVDAAMKIDRHAHFLIQLTFILLALLGFLPSYIIAFSVITIVFVFVMFFDLSQNKNFMRFYHMSFGMHIIFRILILVLFFTHIFKLL
ncbi:Digeranylgeranylglyceryl phosphate synthase [Candidatus Bilamarchaeum dharawalense]|uniref:Digeranylgeranylglyceryl phosphate synthase n=1 Tax=Candidatus Bilamarchaeum dharawalense TaxID=2885759 RepID=A0A5E4LRG9_9ARCH|nr:Digeranylgeranylglyceryl phosphate synthase [Candidatus Bilamarchaeum dharawalense]